ncbi:hypothetical protein D3C83_197600 [compost metagenome]
MRIDSRLIEVALEEHVGVRRFRAVERVELAARLVGAHLGDELLGERFEARSHARLHFDRGDDS